MMGFDRLHRLGPGFNDVRINRPLREEVDPLQLSGLLLKDTDEFRPDDLPLLLRIIYPGQLVQEAVHGINIDQIGIHLVPEYFHHLLRLTFP